MRDAKNTGLRLTREPAPSDLSPTDPGQPAAWRLPLLGAALIVGMFGRIAYSHGATLWFDETFTAVIASQPTFDRLINWCLHELTGPAFYMPMWIWVKLAGNSDVALRLPSLILSIATPLAVLRWGHRDGALRWWWAAFLLLWPPIFALAGEAKSYPEIFALGAAQAAVFMRLLERPSTWRACAWALLSALAVLCHYWCALPALVQGLAFLALHRLRALRTWPALILLIPMLVWSRLHLPFVLGLTIGGSSGINGLPLSALRDIPMFVLGTSANGVLVAMIVLASLGMTVRRDGWPRLQKPSPEMTLALCGLASIAAILLIAFIRPGFSPRYMMGAMPSFLFALALWARRTAPRDARLPLMAAAMLLASEVGVIVSILRHPESDARHMFELERPSAWIAQRPVDHLVIFWDNPVGEVSNASQLAEVGGFFLRRAGHKVEVSVARAPAGTDPNPAVLALTDARRKSAILWFSNDDLPPGRAPHIETLDPRYECHAFSRGMIAVTACRWRG